MSITDDENCVYVLVRDNGCEGKSAPIQAFRTRTEAEAGLALASAAFQSWELFAVPLWPRPATAWPESTSDTVSASKTRASLREMMEEALK
jgi:hypothetical protein